MEKKSKFGSLLSGAGNAAKGLLDKTKDLAVKVADQTGDGKFDMKDVTALAGSVSDAVKKNVQSIKDYADKRALEKELEKLRPIFNESGFSVPKFFHLVERDKEHAESKLCEGSIGYYSENKGNLCVNLFEDSIIGLGIEFDTVGESDFFFRNPTGSNRYIGIKGYFDFLKTARIMELTKIAQDLGAKMFEVTYIDEERTSSEKSFRAEAKAGKLGESSAHAKSSHKEGAYLEIAAKHTFIGHDPIMPQVKYLATEPYVMNLIALRMDSTSPLQNQTISLRMSNSVGITEDEAAKVDALIYGCKSTGGFSMSQQLHSETKRFLEYHIEF